MVMRLARFGLLAVLVVTAVACGSSDDGGNDAKTERTVDFSTGGSPSGTGQQGEAEERDLESTKSLLLSEEIARPERSQIVDGVLWAIDGESVVRISLDTGQVQRMQSGANSELVKLAVGDGRVAAIGGTPATVYAGATDGNQLVALQGGLPEPTHIYAAHGNFWVTGNDGAVMGVFDGRGQQVAVYRSTGGEAPAAVATTPDGVYAVDLNESKGYFFDKQAKLLTTVELLEGDEANWSVAIEGGDILVVMDDGELLHVGKDGSVEQVDAPEDVERAWSDGEGGAIVAYQLSKFARWHPDSAQLGGFVSMGAGEVAGVDDGRVWQWALDHTSLQAYEVSEFS
jgi:hypothetical protein